ncbi:MAG: YihA family ribosome biogenesis GTP-binding protein [bacterium]|nr:YihA family ribosome biogenesis GTP-binding protein [bacterium]
MKIKDSRLERTSFSAKELISDQTKKIIFVGRSNVGKSSLINKLLWRKKLARTSSKPGKTVSINYYRVNDEFFFVDLPGYGYAKISRQEKVRVKGLISTFFSTVNQAVLVVMLIDSRRGFMESDLEVLDQILEKKIKLLTVLTKSDKLRNSELKRQKMDLQNKFGLKVISFTIKSEDNREEVLTYIDAALTE